MFNEEWYPEEQLNLLCKIFELTKGLKGINIEIGCWEGRSTTRLAQTCYPENLVCNDTWEGNPLENIDNPTIRILKVRDVFKIFQENMLEYTDGNYTIVKDDCIVYLASLKESIKFCHIDASHEYSSVKKTLELLLPNMVEGGVLCGDDYIYAGLNRLDLNGGVERAVKELLPEHKAIANFWWWTRG